MQDFEQLGVFYLGRRYDLPRQQPTDELLLYDAKDLTTHAVCVGMTGSGKTGLCLSLLEEAAIDGIPALCIDPKGDLGNLLLAFPQLRSEDFRPWLDPADATRQGITLDELSAQTAQRWREGLAASGQDAARVARYREAVDIAIYTPGSDAGLPLTVLRSFSAPPAGSAPSADAWRERIAGAVSGLLALLGIDADPLRSREHILLSNLLDQAWRQGRDLEMSQLIREIQSPPFDKLGVVDLESFFPAKERFALSMSLNNLLASPGFAAWTQGEPLDIQRLLFTPQGKPRLTILSIAHLSDAERMFFVTLLLNEVLAWMRAQSGTSSLRALLYMDEVFGYFPPTANPPSKTPMLTLLKQARAFGLGVVLATQNPVDLDYKGLSNAGTWFLGRLQTQRDKDRVLDGLEGASTAAGSQFDRAAMEQILSGLGNRVFLMNNVHEDQPVVFQSRFALSFLRGPLSREQIAGLMKDRKAASMANLPVAASPAAAATGTPTPPAAAAGSAAVSTSAPTVPGGAGGQRPVLPPGIKECFVPARQAAPAGGWLCYRPGLVGQARLHYVNSTLGIDLWQDVALAVEQLPSADSAPWEQAQLVVDQPPDLEAEPAASSRFADLPGEFARPKKYTELTTALKDHLYRCQKITVWKCPALKQVASVGESEGDFRARLTHLVREQRDLQVEKLRARFTPKVKALEEKQRKAEQKKEREQQQASQQQYQTVLSIGTSILGALFGRKLASSANVTRASTSIRSASKIAKERADVAQAAESIEAIEQELAELNEQLQQECQKVQEEFSPENLKLEQVELQPRKSDISVSLVALAWSPVPVAPR